VESVPVGVALDKSVERSQVLSCQMYMHSAGRILHVTISRH
jgi:hypothetical protein